MNCLQYRTVRSKLGIFYAPFGTSSEINIELLSSFARKTDLA